MSIKPFFGHKNDVRLGGGVNKLAAEKGSTVGGGLVAVAGIPFRRCQSVYIM
jgi:hypothetical protein